MMEEISHRTGEMKIKKESRINQRRSLLSIDRNHQKKVVQRVINISSNRQFGIRPYHEPLLRRKNMLQEKIRR